MIDFLIDSELPCSMSWTSLVLPWRLLK